MFRGNDPLRKKCCGNILRDHHHALTDTSDTLHTAPTGMGEEIQQSQGKCGTCPVTYTSTRAGWFQRSRCVSQLNQTEVNMLFESVTVKLYYFPTSCWINGIEGLKLQRRFLALSQRNEARRAGLRCSAIAGDRRGLRTSAGITHETKQSETTQNIVDKGPVCRQHADLGRHIFRIAESRTSFLSGRTWCHENGVNVSCKNVTYAISRIKYSIIKTRLTDESILEEKCPACYREEASPRALFFFFFNSWKAPSVSCIIISTWTDISNVLITSSPRERN